jgi:arabinogalactan endo-1,4-beta-galactosidase
MEHRSCRVRFVALFVVLVAFRYVAFTQAYIDDPEFIRGVDLSFLPQIEENGGTFKDHGVTRNELRILRDHGLNFVRLRIWHTDPGGYNGLQRTLAMAARAHDLGFGILLDIHYSGTWADPSHQEMPSGWTALPFNVLKESVYTYTREVVAALTSQGTRPDMVQVGNEISCGMLWNEGNVCGAFDTPAQWDKLAGLLSEGIRGVHDGAGPGHDVRIMIHSDRGADSAGAIWFFDHLVARDLAFDIIGLSYYPWWHGSMDRVDANLDALSRRYDKDVVIVETAYPWTLLSSDATGNIVGSPDQLLPGYPQNALGQKKVLIDLMNIVATTDSGRGKGLFYWAPDWISTPTFGSAWENLALFNFHGDLHVGASAFEKNVDVVLSAGWNLVSVPVTVVDPDVATVYPASASSAFRFSDGYIEGDTLDPGTGYWVKQGSGTVTQLAGLPILAETLAVLKGWNLVGTISNAFPASGITSLPPEILTGPVFGYDGQYVAADILVPGKGYWLKVSHDGLLIFP